MKIGEVRPTLANDLRYRFGLRTHGFYVEDDFAVGRVELLHEPNCLLSLVDEIGFARSQRLKTDGHASLPRTLHRSPQGARRPLPRLLLAHSHQNLPILR